MFKFRSSSKWSLNYQPLGCTFPSQTRLISLGKKQKLLIITSVQHLRLMNVKIHFPLACLGCVRRMSKLRTFSSENHLFNSRAQSFRFPSCCLLGSPAIRVKPCIIRLFSHLKRNLKKTKYGLVFRWTNDTRIFHHQLCRQSSQEQPAPRAICAKTSFLYHRN